MPQKPKRSESQPTPPKRSGKIKFRVEVIRRKVRKPKRTLAEKIQRRRGKP